MGGRGARSGISDNGNKYGSQYYTLHEIENIKFVQANTRQSEALMETMTDGRIYAVVGGGKDLLRIILFDNENKRNKSIGRDKRTGTWHVHNGYEHTEYDNIHANEPNNNEKSLIDKIVKEWYSFLSKA